MSSIRSHSSGGIFAEYAANLRLFRPNARLFLLALVLNGAAIGVFRLLFNFYILSLGYDEALLGNLVTTSNLAALIAALPMGYLSDLLGRKLSMISSGLLMSAAIAGMVLLPGIPMFLAMNVVFGLAQCLMAVTMSPFMVENSGEEERTYLFSFGTGLQTASGSVGNWIGGYLPTWFGALWAVSPTHSLAYGGALLSIAATAALAVLPLFLMRMPALQRSERTVFAPVSYARKNPKTLSKLILPLFLTSIGAGLIMPFQNVFFRQVYHQPDPVIGSLFAWGSLAMGIGLLIAPPLADRIGKVELVVITQGLSIPFLIMLGFAPWFWMSAAAYYVRLALMNMSTPVYQTYVMEHVEPSARAMVASLVSMSWNFGWAFSPTISGWLQVHYGFGPPYLGTILLYTVSVILYWAFFWRGSRRTLPVPSPGD